MQQWNYEIREPCPWVSSDGQQFINPHIPEVSRNWKDFFLWMIGCFKDPEIEAVKPMPAGFAYPLPAVKEETGYSITWINHSTFLIQTDGVWILTDPIWAKRTSPLSFIGPKRHHAPPMSIEQLPNIDYVLVSHDHYDHLDTQAVKALNSRFPNITWLVPLGLKRLLRKLGVRHIVEMNWWEHYAPAIGAPGGGRLLFHAVPAQHFSGRGLTDLNKTLWAGWVVERLGENRKRFYFAGDTGYNPYDFKEIGERLGPMDLSILPIGAYRPRPFMRAVHVCPEEAVQIHLDVQSKQSVASHWKTFRLSEEGMERPPYDLFQAMHARELPIDTFCVLTPGQPLHW